MGRVDPSGRNRYDAVRKCRSLRRWADGFAERWRDIPAGQRDYWNWKIPMPRALVSAPGARLPVQKVCAQALVDAAWRLSQASSPEMAHARVVAIVSFPDMFASEVCAFLSEDYFNGFCERDDDDQRWAPMPASNGLAARLGLRLPAGFQERGYWETCRDETADPPWITEGEVWLIGELESTGRA